MLDCFFDDDEEKQRRRRLARWRTELKKENVTLAVMIASLEGFLWRKTFSALHRSAVARQEISWEEHRHHRWSLLQTRASRQYEWFQSIIHDNILTFNIKHMDDRFITRWQDRSLLLESEFWLLSSATPTNWMYWIVFSQKASRWHQRIQELYWVLCFKGRAKWRSPQTGIKMKNLEVKQQHRPGRFYAVPPASVTVGAAFPLSVHPHGLVVVSIFTNCTSHVFGANS